MKYKKIPEEVFDKIYKTLRNEIKKLEADQIHSQSKVQGIKLSLDTMENWLRIEEDRVIRNRKSNSKNK